MENPPSFIIKQIVPSIVNDRDQFEIKICPPLPGNDAKCQVKWMPIAPEESKNGPFNVEKSKCVILAKTLSTFKVQYYLNEERKCNSVITASPKLINQDDENKLTFELGVLAVRLRAETFVPKLELHKLPNITGNI